MLRLLSKFPASNASTLQGSLRLASKPITRHSHSRTPSKNNKSNEPPTKARPEKAWLERLPALHHMSNLMESTSAKVTISGVLDEARYDVKQHFLKSDTKDFAQKTQLVIRESNQKIEQVSAEIMPELSDIDKKLAFATLHEFKILLLQMPHTPSTRTLDPAQHYNFHDLTSNLRLEQQYLQHPAIAHRAIYPHHSISETALEKALRSISEIGFAAGREVNCSISPLHITRLYPEAALISDEPWLLPFTQNLQQHLSMAGIEFDPYIHSSMDTTHIIQFGSRRLSHAYQQHFDWNRETLAVPLSKLHDILHPETFDFLAPEFIPISLSSTPSRFNFPTYYHYLYKPFSFSSMSYLKGLKELIRRLYQFEPCETSFEKIWNELEQANWDMTKKLSSTLVAKHLTPRPDFLSNHVIVDQSYDKDNAIYRFLQKNPILQATCHSAIAPDHVDIYLEKLKPAPQSKPINLTEFYETIIDISLSTHFRLPFKHETTTIELKHSFACLAFKMVINETQSLNYEYVGCLSMQQHQLIDGQLRNNKIANLLLIQDNQVSFSSLVIQEYFAASYITTFFVAKSLQNTFIKEYSIVTALISKHRFNPQYQILWRFVAGMLLDHPKFLQEFFNLLNEGVDQNTANGLHKKIVTICMEECTHAPDKLDQAQKHRLEKALQTAKTEADHGLEWLQLKCLPYFDQAPALFATLLRFRSELPYKSHPLSQTYFKQFFDEKYFDHHLNQALREDESRQLLEKVLQILLPAYPQIIVAILIEAAQTDADEYVRKVSLRVLAKTANFHVQELNSLLLYSFQNDHAAGVQLAAIMGLVDIAHTHPDAVIHSLCQLALSTTHTRFVSTILNGFSNLSPLLADIILPVFEKLLLNANTDNDIREAAIKALMKMAEFGQERILKLLHSIPTPSSHYNYKTLVQQAIHSLEHPEPKFNNKSVQTMVAQYPYFESDRENQIIRNFETWCDISGSKAIPAVINTLTQARNSIIVTRLMLMLAKIASAQPKPVLTALKALFQQLNDTWQSYIFIATDNFPKKHHPQVEIFLLDRLNQSDSAAHASRAIQSLTELGPAYIENNIELLQKLLEQFNKSSVTEAVLEAISIVGGDYQQQALTMIKPLLSHKDISIFTAALLALSKLSYNNSLSLVQSGVVFSNPHDFQDHLKSLIVTIDDLVNTSRYNHGCGMEGMFDFIILDQLQAFKSIAHYQPLALFTVIQEMMDQCNSKETSESEVTAPEDNSDESDNLASTLAHLLAELSPEFPGETAAIVSKIYATQQTKISVNLTTALARNFSLSFWLNCWLTADTPHQLLLIPIIQQIMLENQATVTHDFKTGQVSFFSQSASGHDAASFDRSQVNTLLTYT